MAVTITLDFDDTWAGRLQPMIVEFADEIRDDPIVVALLLALGIGSVDDLTDKQKAKLILLFYLLTRLQNYEGQVAAEDARDIVIDDIADNFPLEVGDPT